MFIFTVPRCPATQFSALKKNGIPLSENELLSLNSETYLSKSFLCKVRCPAVQFSAQRKWEDSPYN